jgi:hypothetical protein
MHEQEHQAPKSPHKSPRTNRRSNRRSHHISGHKDISAATAEVAAPKEPTAAVAVEPAPTTPVEAAAGATLEAAPAAHEDTAAAAGEEPVHAVGEEAAPVATESWRVADPVDEPEATAGVAADAATPVAAPMAAPVTAQACVAHPVGVMPAEVTPPALSPTAYTHDTFSSVDAGHAQVAAPSANTPSSIHATGTPVAMPAPVDMAGPPRPFVPIYHPAMYPYGVRPQMVPLPGGGQGSQVPLPGDMQRLHTLVPINMAHGGRPINGPQVANPSPQMVAMHTLPGHPTYQVRLLPSLAISTVVTA